MVLVGVVQGVVQVGRQHNPMNDETRVEQEVEPEVVKDGKGGKAKRSVCQGGFCRKLAPGNPKLAICYFKDRHIVEPKHKKTLKAIMRANWPFTRIDVRHGIVARREFITNCAKNFWVARCEKTSHANEDSSNEDSSDEDLAL